MARRTPFQLIDILVSVSMWYL